MALTTTYPTLSTSFTSTEVDTNFSDIVSWAAGGITNANISASAAIAITKLANQYQEAWVNLTWRAAGAGAGPGTAPWTAVVDPANITIAEMRAQCIAVPLPGTDTTDPPWTATDVSWVCTDCGTVAGAFQVSYGALNAGGTVWVRAGTIVTPGTMTVSSDNNGNKGRALENGSVSITQSTTVRDIMLCPLTTGTNVLTNAGDFLSVTVALRRQIQA